VLLLHTLTLLDRYKVLPKVLVGIIQQSRTDEEFNSKIAQYVKDTSAFNKEWRLAGVNQNKLSIWDRLLTTYFYQEIASKIASVLRYSRDEVSNNVDGCSTVIHLVATELSESDFALGTNLAANIQKITETIILNSRKEYATKFSVRLADPNVQTALLGDSVDHSIVFDNSDQALANVPASEVRCLLSDIYETKSMYYINSELTTRTQYSIYESFVKAYFEHQMESLNEELRGYATIKMEEMSSVKFKKLDELMRAVLTDFILPGVTLENVYELQKIVAIHVQTHRVTNAAPPFVQKEIKSEEHPNAVGNFHNKFTFSSESAANQFHKLISAFIALSKLYRYIVLAGKQPYDISIDTFMYDDPSMKFTSLKDLVYHSDVYSEVRSKYNITEDFSMLANVTATRNQAAEILANRKEISLNSLIRTTQEIREGESGYVYLAQYDKKLDLFTAVTLLGKGKNPLYALFPRDEILDADVIIDDIEPFFTELFGSEVARYSQFRLEPDTMQNLLEVSDGDLKTFLSDLLSFDAVKQEKIFSALGYFLDDFSDMLNSHMRRYAGCSVSQVELSTIILKADLLKNLRGDRQDYANVDKVASILLSRYDEEITAEDIHAFFQRDCQNDSFSRLLEVVKQNIFKNIGSTYKDADLYLFNLQDVGKQLCLTGSSLLKALNNVTDVPDLERFRKRFADVRKNEYGYFIDESGNLRSTRTRNNKTGFLHSQGVYVFLDGETEPWE
jgi:hypothetical protein